VLWHFAACTSVNCRTSQCPGHDVKMRPHQVKLYLTGFVLGVGEGADVIVKHISTTIRLPIVAFVLHCNCVT